LLFTAGGLTAALSMTFQQRPLSSRCRRPPRRTWSVSFKTLNCVLSTPRASLSCRRTSSLLAASAVSGRRYFFFNEGPAYSLLPLLPATRALLVCKTETGKKVAKNSRRAASIAEGGRRRPCRRCGHQSCGIGLGG